MVSYRVTVSKGIDGYNPPEYYRTIDSEETADIFISNVVSQSFTNAVDMPCKHSIDNGIGRIEVSYSNDDNQIMPNSPISVVLIRADNHSYYVGIVDKIRVKSANTYEISYTVDWYTTYVLSYYTSGVGAIPTGKTVLCRRLTDGEFKWLDEGHRPLKISMNNYRLSLVNYNDNSSPDEEVMYNETDTTRCFVMYYHESISNTNHVIFVDVYGGLPINPKNWYIDPKTIWWRYLDYMGISTNTYTFDPSNVIFFGCSYIKGNVFCANAIYTWTHGNNTYYAIYQQNTVTSGGTKIFESTDYAPYSTKLMRLWIKYPFYIDYYSTEYSRLRLLSGNGTLLYEFEDGFKTGSSVSGASKLVGKFYLTGTESNPSITFEFGDFSELWPTSNGVNGAKSFTIPFERVSYWADTYQVYLAEERNYNMEMRNLQSINELVSGVIGGANQGAMISAFSRSSGMAGLNKGLIGGGVAVASAGANYAYQYLYANKEATAIEDRYNRCKPDTLAFAGTLPIDLIQTGGVWIFKYDEYTTESITTYQSKFGYATNRIYSDKLLNEFEDYIQAEILFAPGLRTEVERYIKDMFNNGVWFTKITE